MKKAIIYFFLVFILVSTTLAVKDTQVIMGEDEGLIIELPPHEVLKQSREYKLHVHVFNKTNGYPIKNDTAFCLVHLYNLSGSHILEDNMSWDSNNVDFQLTIDGGNFSDSGFVSYIIQCNTSSVGGAVAGQFQVTPTGEEKQDYLGLYIMLIAVGLFFMLVAIVLFFDGRKQAREQEKEKE